VKPVLTVTSRVSTRDWAVDLPAPVRGAAATPADLTIFSAVHEVHSHRRASRRPRPILLRALAPA
jgi:hypothetical protein